MLTRTDDHGRSWEFYDSRAFYFILRFRLQAVVDRSTNLTLFLKEIRIPFSFNSRICIPSACLASPDIRLRPFADTIKSESYHLNRGTFLRESVKFIIFSSK